MEIIESVAAAAKIRRLLKKKEEMITKIKIENNKVKLTDEMKGGI